MLRVVGILLFLVISDISCATPSDSLLVPSQNSPPTCDREYSCEDCKTVKICVATWSGPIKPLSKVKCSDKTPYCDPETGTCKEIPSSDTCWEKSTNFVCSKDGRFPNPNDCNTFYSCVKGQAYLGSCVDVMYNLQTQSCQKSDTCNKIDCSGLNGVKVAHTSDPAYFAYCADSKVLRIDKCPGQFQLDSDLQKCMPTCKVQKIEADPFDSTKYYKCADKDGVLTLDHLQCPSGEIFNAVNSNCVIDNDNSFLTQM